MTRCHAARDPTGNRFCPRYWSGAHHATKVPLAAPLGISFAGFFLLIAGQAFAAFPDTPPPGTSWNFTAVQTGPWNDPCTWKATPCGTALPLSTSNVRIPSGFTVTIQDTAATASFVRVEGILKHWIHSNTQLAVETLYIAPGATFSIGDANNPVKTGLKAQVVFTGSGTINPAWDPKELSRGMVADGNVLLFGIRKKAWLTLVGEAAAGATSSASQDRRSTPIRSRRPPTRPGSRAMRSLSREPISSASTARPPPPRATTNARSPPFPARPSP